MRKSEITRETNETKVSVSINLDGTGKYSNKTNVGFLITCWINYLVTL